MRRYGWTKDDDDPRDYRLALPPVALPAKVTLGGMPPVKDQGAWGSCTANAIATAFEYDEIRQNLPHDPRSRAYLYWGERVYLRTTHEDSGAQLRDGMKVIAKRGAPSEALWPYDQDHLFTAPTRAVNAAAKLHKAVTYQRVAQTEVGIKTALAAGYPVVFGFTAYPALESATVAQTGLLPMPAPGEQPIGGHAVVAYGYDDANRVVRVRNSWGPWGDQNSGDFWMPYAYVASPDLASDFWTISSIT